MRTSCSLGCVEREPADGIEVDFVRGDGQLAIEVKAIRQVSTQRLHGLGAFVEDHPEVARRILVCLEPRHRRTASGIEIIPMTTFLKDLWAGRIA